MLDDHRLEHDDGACSAVVAVHDRHRVKSRDSPFLLILGLAVSLYTAVYVARVIFDVFERQRWLTKLRMMQFIGETRIDFCFGGARAGDRAVAGGHRDRALGGHRAAARCRIARYRLQRWHIGPDLVQTRHCAACRLGKSAEP